MLQRDAPGDFVIASGELHTVRDLAERAFAHVSLDWREHVRVDEALLRGDAELHRLVGGASKARDALGWRPRSPRPGEAGFGRYSGCFPGPLRPDLCAASSGRWLARKRPLANSAKGGGHGF